ncbi:MAG TPA: TonB family protein [Elusimicrobiota bacterium]|nr:TonB family protein [Elusimicrobiota bacterium]
MMRSWNLLYERQPLQLDVLLLSVALILHAPLMFLHFKAPPKRHGAKSLSRLVNIDYIEEQIKKRKEKPVVLPPKIPEAPKKLQEMVKKVEEVKQQIFQRSLPPPPLPAKPKIQDTIARGPEAKLQANLLKDKLEQEKRLLQGKGSFAGKELKLSGPNDTKDLKIGGGGAALTAGSRLSAVGGANGGPKLQGKSGFQVSKDAMPMSIGGDDGDLKIGGGGNIVVVPVGARAQADKSILSPTVGLKDKGALMAQGPGGLTPRAESAAPALAGTGGASAITIGGSSRQTSISAPPAAAAKEGKRLDSKQMPNPLADAMKTPTSAPALPALPRRMAPKVQKPMFLITGPLADRKALSRVVPEYPEWAREKGVEAAVLIQFTVTPEGAVKDNMLVVRTSGYPPLDALAVKALAQWKFAPLPPDQYRDEIGTITFNFSVQ